MPDGKQFAFKFVTDKGEWLDVPDSAPNRIEREGALNFQFNPEQTGRHIFRFHTPHGYQPVGNEKIIWRDAKTEESHELPRTQFLTSVKTGLDLGSIVEGNKTTFRLFAPRADSVKLCYGQNLDGSDTVIASMACIDGLTWELIIDQNLDNYYYSYRVGGLNIEGTSHFDDSFPILDPYAKACVGSVSYTHLTLPTTD